MSEQNINDGGSAFPTETLHGQDYGMTLRDYFAAAALRGLVDEGHGLREIADECYLLADAMLERRKR